MVENEFRNLKKKFDEYGGDDGFWNWSNLIEAQKNKILELEKSLKESSSKLKSIELEKG